MRARESSIEICKTKVGRGVLIAVVEAQKNNWFALENPEEAVEMTTPETCCWKLTSHLKNGK